MCLFCWQKIRFYVTLSPLLTGFICLNWLQIRFKDDLPTQIQCANIRSLTREMFKLVSLKVLKLLSCFGKNVFLKVLTPWFAGRFSKTHKFWIYAGINFIHNHPPGQTPETRLKGSKKPSSGTIILYKNPPLRTIQEVKSPTPGT